MKYEKSEYKKSITGIFDEYYIKVIEFLESYDKDLFTQQTLIDNDVTYHMRISHILNDLFKWNIIQEVSVQGMGRVRLYRFNRHSEIYKLIIELREAIK